MTEAGGRAWRQTTFHPFAQASAYGRGRVIPHPATGTTVTDGVLRAELEPLSWNMIRLSGPDSRRA